MRKRDSRETGGGWMPLGKRSLEKRDRETGQIPRHSPLLALEPELTQI